MLALHPWKARRTRPALTQAVGGLVGCRSLLSKDEGHVRRCLKVAGRDAAKRSGVVRCIDIMRRIAEDERSG